MANEEKEGLEKIGTALDEIKDGIEAERKEVKDLKDELEKAQSEIEDFSETVKSLEDENAQLREYSEDLKEKIEDVKEIGKSLQEIETEIKDLKTKEFQIVTPDSLDKAIYKDAAKFFKDLRNGTLEKSVNESTGSQGGYFIPTPISDKIVDLSVNYGIARKYATILPMKSYTLKVNTLDTVTSAFLDAGSSITARNITAGQVTFTAKKAGTLIDFDSEWLEDTTPEIAEAILRMVAKGLARIEDHAAFIADGDDDSTDGEHTGLLENSDIGSVTLADGSVYFSNVTWGKIGDLIDAVTAENLERPLFIMNRTMRSVLRNLNITSEFGPPFKPSDTKDVDTIWGYPVEYSSLFPSTASSDSDEVGKPFIVFGDMASLGFAERRELTVKQDYKISTDQVQVLTTERFNIRPLNDNAFARLITASS